MRRIVLAYVGDLESSVAIPWLTERYGAEVVTVTLDLGQASDLTDVRERALAAGAVRAHVIDGREEMVRDFITPALQAGALCECRDPFALELGRALVAKRLVEIAEMESASEVAHGSTDTGGETASLVTALETLLRRRDSSLTVLSPVGLWQMPRVEAIDYARRRHLAIPTEDDVASVNLWGRSVSRDALHSRADPRDSLFTMTRPLEDCPDEAAYLAIELERGLPVRANGIEKSMLEMIESLAIIGGAHGVGRIDQVVTEGGTSHRIVHEAPAACLLGAAYRALETLVLPADANRKKRQFAGAYANLLRDGKWFSFERETIDAFVRTVQPQVTGRVALRLFKGTHEVHAVDAHLDRAGQEVTS